MRTVSKGRCRRWHLWVWPPVFVIVITLVLITALLPWTKSEMGATLTGPAAPVVKNAASAPAPRAEQDGGFALAPPPSTAEESAFASEAMALGGEAPARVPPPTTVEGGRFVPVLASDAMEDSAAVPAPTPNEMGAGASAPPAPISLGSTTSAPPAPPNAVQKQASSPVQPPNTGERGPFAPGAAPNIDQRGLLAALLRHGSRPEGLTPADYPGVDVLLATPLYFRFTGRRPPAVDQPSIVFFVSEEVHVGDLPPLPPRPLARTGGVYHEPVEVRMLTDSPHHRTTMVFYSAAWSDGGLIVAADAPSLDLVFPAASGASAAHVLSWELPISYGPGYSSGEVFLAQ